MCCAEKKKTFATYHGHGCNVVRTHRETQQWRVALPVADAVQEMPPPDLAFRDSARQRSLSMQYHRCFCGSWSSQSCSKRTPMSNTTELFPVLTSTGTRLHPTGFRMSRIAACTTCCQWTAREVANDLCVRESSHHISNPWTTQASSNNNTRTAGISKFKMGSTYLLLSAFIVVTRRLRLRKRASHKDYVQGRRQAASSPL